VVGLDNAGGEERGRKKIPAAAYSFRNRRKRKRKENGKRAAHDRPGALFVWNTNNDPAFRERKEALAFYAKALRKSLLNRLARRKLARWPEGGRRMSPWAHYLSQHNN